MTTGVRRRMGVEERKQQLIGVALELFSHRSPDEVSIDEIAAAAGISRPLVYHYFPGKQSLYEAALRRAADELAARFVEPPQGPLGARLLRVMGRFFDFVDDHGPGFAALMRGGPAVGSSTTNAMIDEVRHAAYESSFGHAFVISLDGVRPGERLDQVLAGIRSRLGNEPEEERVVAADELRRLARARLAFRLAEPLTARHSGP
ncbi:TetR family transcriptional regulator [Streptomyces sp. SID6041]|nr:TetR family transcriptional regulator [Streptomyces sp. SID6041]